MFSFNTVFIILRIDQIIDRCSKSAARSSFMQNIMYFTRRKVESHLSANGAVFGQL